MQNEILKPVLDTDEVAVPRYDIVGPNGSVIQQNVELRLKNEVVQEGTPYDEESVLPASLREQLELPQPATPAEAFLKMLKVGGGAVARNRAPTSADAQTAGKIWIVPKMSFNNLMPNALSQSASNWACTAASASASGKAATITGDGTAASLVGLISMNNASFGDSVFVQADITVNADANKVTLELLCGDVVVAVKEMDVPASGATAQLVARPTLEATGALKLKVAATYNTASVQSGKSITVANITVWNLTADMCQIEADLEFSQEDAASYIEDYGMFQSKEYELSQYWWVCRGVLDGEYYWYRYDELANLKVNLSDKASTAQAQAGTADNKWMTPLKAQQFLTNRLATQAEAYAGTNNTKVMTPARVKDAMLNALKVGDVLETYRTDLGEHWLLCDGGAFDASTYPQLAAITPDFISKLTSPRVTSVPGKPDCYLEANGYKACSYRSSGTGCYVVYSTDNWKTYTRNLIASITSDSSGRNAASGLFYANGYYILLVSGSGVYPGSLEVYYTTDITSTSWTHGASNDSYSYGHGWGKFYDLWYSGGTYYLAGAGSSDTSAGTSYAYVASATNPGFTSTSAVTKVYDSQIGVADFIRTDSRLAFVGYYNGTYHVLYSTPSAPKAYTHATFTISGTAPSSAYLTTGHLSYVNGRYCFCGYTDSYIPVVVSTTDLTSATWTGVSLGITQSSNSYMPRGFVCYIRGKYYIPGYYVAGNSSYVGWYVGTSLTSSTGWTFYSCYDADGTSRTVNYNIKPMEEDGYLVLSAASAFLKYPIYALPAASNDNTYKYIKGKEVT